MSELVVGDQTHHLDTRGTNHRAEMFRLSCWVRVTYDLFDHGSREHPEHDHGIAVDRYGVGAEERYCWDQRVFMEALFEVHGGLEGNLDHRPARPARLVVHADRKFSSDL